MNSDDLLFNNKFTQKLNVTDLGINKVKQFRNDYTEKFKSFGCIFYSRTKMLSYWIYCKASSEKIDEIKTWYVSLSSVNDLHINVVESLAICSGSKNASEIDIDKENLVIWSNVIWDVSSNCWVYVNSSFEDEKIFKKWVDDKDKSFINATNNLEINPNQIQHLFENNNGKFTTKGEKTFSFFYTFFNEQINKFKITVEYKFENTFYDEQPQNLQYNFQKILKMIIQNDIENIYNKLITGYTNIFLLNVFYLFINDESELFLNVREKCNLLVNKILYQVLYIDEELESTILEMLLNGYGLSSDGNLPSQTVRESIFKKYIKDEDMRIAKFLVFLSRHASKYKQEYLQDYYYFMEGTVFKYIKSLLKDKDYDLENYSDTIISDIYYQYGPEEYEAYSYLFSFFYYNSIPKEIVDKLIYSRILDFLQNFYSSFFETLPKKNSEKERYDLYNKLVETLNKDDGKGEADAWSQLLYFLNKYLNEKNWSDLEKENLENDIKWINTKQIVFVNKEKSDDKKDIDPMIILTNFGILDEHKNAS